MTTCEDIRCLITLTTLIAVVGVLEKAELGSWLHSYIVTISVIFLVWYFMYLTASEVWILTTVDHT